MKNDKILDEMKEYFKVSSIEDVAVKLGYSEATANTWRSRGISNAAINKYKLIKSNDYNKKQNESQFYDIPKLSLKVSAGGGNHLESIDKFEVVENLKLDKRLFKTPQKNLKSIQVDGYSMIPMVLPDSWVVFDDTKEYKGDGLYVLNYANTLMVKLIQLNPNGCIEIISVNKDYKSYTVCEDDQNVFKIVGRVVKIIV